MTTIKSSRRNPTLRLRTFLMILVVMLIGATACTDAKRQSDDATRDGVKSGPYEATIHRTTGGVAHIVASDLGNLAFGQGYASGEDHTCDLAQEIVKVNSSRSRWFGPGDADANLNSDFGWLALGIRARAETDYPTQSDEVHQMMAGFVAGWNRHLEQAGTGGINGWCKGEPWVTPISELDLYTYSRSVMLLASGVQLLDYIADAQPPSGDAGSSGAEAAWATESDLAAEPDPAPDTHPFASGQPLSSSDSPIASNGWAIGSERSDSGGGLLLANPHFPWEGPLRFWEVGLEIPGEMNVYGAQLTGLPGVGIGFNEAVAWTHTVSAGNRFTAYTLELVDGDPTSYRYDDDVRKMESEERQIDVLQPDGSTAPVTRTLWRSHYGPIVDFPGVGWSESRTMTYRDANIDNTEFFDQYLGMDRARSLDDFIDAHADHTGVPLFNTVATAADGRTWYADTSATPNLSPEALTSYEQSLGSDLLVSMAAKRGVVLLDGSNSANEWIDEAGSRSPGLVPFSKMPQTTRSDYVFNANDSFWLSNADHMLAGDYSPLHGRQAEPVSPRTHQNAVLLRDSSASGPSGSDGRFSLDELAQAAFANSGWTARQLLSEVVTRCDGTPTVDVSDSSIQGQPSLPAATVDISEACRILGTWDGRYDLDSVGPGIWRELLSQFKPADLTDSGPLFAVPFDPANPVDTPSGLALPPSDEAGDVVLVALARAVQTFELAQLPLDSKLGDLQYADRNGVRVPIHGGNSVDGVTNVVTWSPLSFPSGETLPAMGTRVTPWSSLTKAGYTVNAGTSFVLAVQFTDSGPIAQSILTYSNTGDRSSPSFVDATEDFSNKRWKTVAFTSDQVSTDPDHSVQTVTS